MDHHLHASRRMSSRTPGARLGAAATLAALALISSISPDTLGARSGTEPHEFLRTVAGFSASDLAALEGGMPVAKALDTDKREIAIVGAVRVKAPRERLFDEYRNVAGLRKSQVFMQVGTFSATPHVEDLRGLTFEESDLDQIRECKPGDCGVRLPAESMARFHRDVNWRAADWLQQAGSLWRRELADYAASYLSSGNRALAEYQNKEVPLSVAQEFKVLFDQSAYFRPAAPEFFRYLEEFPNVALEGAESILYWDKEAFGMRPVVSLTHLTLYAAPAPHSPSAPSAFVATKQIYATHYFDAALGLSLVFDDNDSGFYLMCVHRARTRSLTSFIRGVVRMTVRKRSRDAMEKILGTTKLTLEQQPVQQDR